MTICAPSSTYPPTSRWSPPRTTASKPGAWLGDPVELGERVVQIRRQQIPHAADSSQRFATVTGERQKSVDRDRSGLMQDAFAEHPRRVGREHHVGVRSRRGRTGKAEERSELAEVLAGSDPVRATPRRRRRGRARCRPRPTRRRTRRRTHRPARTPTARRRPRPCASDVRRRPNPGPSSRSCRRSARGGRRGSTPRSCGPATGVRCSRRMIASAWMWSRLAVGSSASRSGGSLPSPRATAMRCCWPPESFDGRGARDR